MNKPHKHAALLMQYAQDAAKISEPWLLYEITVYGGDGVWRALMKDAVFLDIGGCIRRKSNADELLADMLNPKLKPVDMSVLIGSGVDCVFIPDQTYSPLLSISDDGRYCRSVDQVGWKRCEPRLNHWFSRLSADSPKIVVRLSDAGFDIRQSTSVYDNISYQIRGLKDGYCWPWELEE